MSSVNQLGKFDITGQLGQGSFGVVYRGHDPHLNRDVAIKVCTLDDDELRQRFLREAAISGRLDHRNIVTVHEYSSEGKAPFLVQEFLSGEDLRQVIKERRPWPVVRRLDALQQIAEGLAYAHGEGVIHRDIKPANVRVLDDGRIKILDFGIAKLANDESRLTQKGVTMGTASYLPPEQVRGGDVDTRSDLFSFGVLAYELLTFERPFRGKTISALVYQILYKVPASLTAVWPDCPQELADIVARCLEKDPEKRYADAGELAADLARIREEVAAGRWPALSSGAGPQQPTVREDEASKSDLLSQSVIARAAHEAGERAAREHEPSTGSASTPTASLSSSLARRGDSEATQPVPIMPAPGEQKPAQKKKAAGARPGAGTASPPPAASAKTARPAAPSAASRPPNQEEVATVAMQLSDLPMPQVASPPPETDELATSGIEIGKLVAQGDLDAALEQLEETIQRQRQDDEPAADGPASTPPPLPTRPPPEAAAVPPPPPVAKPGEQNLQPSSTPPPPARKGRRQLPIPLVVGAVAAVVVLAAAFALFFGRGEKPQPAAPPPVVPAPPPPVADVEELGSLLVLSTPWAELTEITDAAGYVHDLPADPTTPLHLELPQGLYRLTLLVPSGEAGESTESVCEVRVGVGEMATCSDVVGEPTATDLFKDAGWWR